MVDETDARRSWRDAGIPKRHGDCAAECAAGLAGGWGNAYASLKSKIGDGFIVLLVGVRGTGKTQMAVCLCRAGVEIGRTVKYVKAMDLFREMRSCFRKDGPDEVKLLDTYTRYGILVIDEAHERGESEWENRSLINLIDRRYDRMVDTIMIGNQTPETFAESVGPSIVSRVSECGECIVCDWPSYRA